MDAASSSHASGPTELAQAPLRQEAIEGEAAEKVETGTRGVPEPAESIPAP